jgi:hypothetical protein
MADTNEHEVIELEQPIFDATNLIIDEVVDADNDDDDYEELIVLDLRKSDHHDAWMC